MTEVPKDVMEMTRRTLDNMPNRRAEMTTDDFWGAVEVAVAATIMVERERCASILDTASSLTAKVGMREGSDKDRALAIVELCNDLASIIRQGNADV